MNREAAKPLFRNGENLPVFQTLLLGDAVMSGLKYLSYRVCNKIAKFGLETQFALKK